MSGSPERAELAPVDGMTVPGGLPRGEFYSTILDDGSLRIDRADPRIVISAEVIEQAASGRLGPRFTVTMLDYTVPNGHAGALLKIRAANRNVVYRLTEWVPSIRAYVGEWPE